ncbi:MAG: GNAT family N-acetyltransferase [Clostridia bacterium]|nr:GNAT family N-acetyltransferase [Clostridia bacterium]
MRGFFSTGGTLPVLETERLILRQLLVRDRDDMYEYASNPAVTEYLMWQEHPSPEYTAKYLRYIQPRYRRGELFDWAIVLREQNKMIGTCGFCGFDTTHNCAEAGYVVSDRYWGQSYAAEALNAVIDFGFSELSLQRIFARHIVGNCRSGKVMEKCGMQYEGIMRGSMYIKNRYRDVAVYAILREDRNQTP